MPGGAGVGRERRSSRGGRFDELRLGIRFAGVARSDVWWSEDRLSSAEEYARQRSSSTAQQSRAKAIESGVEQRVRGHTRQGWDGVRRGGCSLRWSARRNGDPLAPLCSLHCAAPFQPPLCLSPCLRHARGIRIRRHLVATRDQKRSQRSGCHRRQTTARCPLCDQIANHRRCEHPRRTGVVWSRVAAAGQRGHTTSDAATGGGTSAREQSSSGDCSGTRRASRSTGGCGCIGRTPLVDVAASPRSAALVVATRRVRLVDLSSEAEQTRPADPVDVRVGTSTAAELYAAATLVAAVGAIESTEWRGGEKSAEEWKPACIEGSRGRSIAVASKSQHRDRSSQATSLHTCIDLVRCSCVTPLLSHR